MKELKDICVDSGWAKKLKEKGFIQESNFYVRANKKNESYVNNTIYFKDALGGEFYNKEKMNIYYISMPMSDELMKQLENQGVSLYFDKDRYIACHSPNDTFQSRDDKKPANALAKIWLYIDEYNLWRNKK